MHLCYSCFVMDFAGTESLFCSSACARDKRYLLLVDTSTAFNYKCEITRKDEV